MLVIALTHGPCHGSTSRRTSPAPTERFCLVLFGSGLVWLATPSRVTENRSLRSPIFGVSQLGFKFRLILVVLEACLQPLLLEAMSGKGSSTTILLGRHDAADIHLKVRRGNRRKFIFILRFNLHKCFTS